MPSPVQRVAKAETRGLQHLRLVGGGKLAAAFRAERLIYALSDLSDPDHPRDNPQLPEGRRAAELRAKLVPAGPSIAYGGDGAGQQVPSGKVRSQ